MKKYYLVIATFIISFYGCNGIYEKVIENQEELIELSSYKDITNDDDDRHYYELITYSSDYKQKNWFVFEKHEENPVSYSLIHAEIEIPMDTVIGIDMTSEHYVTEILDYYEKVSKIIRSYKIKSLVGKRDQSTPNQKLKIYLEGGGGMKYYPNGISEAEIEDIDGYKDMGGGWYCY
ncbi:hypothetical protein [Bacteroides sp. 519]|uniref:hypothetical protein n=1 Tax=Bacteroides sp. 519 TaxID=2302937 RepID=UPI0013D8D2A4|nr:hypothetical protein [Bacteroides sp. 519]NDV60164.1 hypothetical protein [Bacteroides sp. 519]